MRYAIRLKEPEGEMFDATGANFSYQTYVGVEGRFTKEPREGIRAFIPWSNIISVVEVPDA